MRRTRYHSIALLLAGLVMSCQRAEVDPCAGLMNEGPLRQIGVLFVDKETGENMIKGYGLDTSNIKITIGYNSP